MARVAVATLGCKVNQYESAGFLETLGENGFTPVPFDGPADLYIINTCTVTGRSDRQSRNLIRRAARNNPEAAVLVTGCYAQIFPDEIIGIPGVSLVAGNEEKGNILRLMNEVAKGEKKAILSDMRQVKEFTTPAVGTFPGRTRAFLKIQDGCDTFCSYCIVPYARGKSRSLPEREVLSRIEALTGKGYREVVLTGINLGAYGRDLHPKTDILALLCHLERETPQARFRLSSLEPLEISEDMLSFLRGAPLFCPHFHIPLQSGDDGILSCMGRKYDAAFFRDLVEKIVHYLPDAAIGVDIMVGFPGEGEEAFRNTCRLIEELPLAYLHVFPYAPRRGTPAASFPHQVTEGDKRNRAAVMRRLGRKKREDFAGRFLGRELIVLLEGQEEGSAGWLQGFSQNYIPVRVVRGRRQPAGAPVRVLAEAMQEGKLTGRVIDP